MVIQCRKTRKTKIEPQGYVLICHFLSTTASNLLEIFAFLIDRCSNLTPFPISVIAFQHYLIRLYGHLISCFLILPPPVPPVTKETIVVNVPYSALI